MIDKSRYVLGSDPLAVAARTLVEKFKKERKGAAEYRQRYTPKKWRLEKETLVTRP